MARYHNEGVPDGTRVLHRWRRRAYPEPRVQGRSATRLALPGVRRRELEGEAIEIVGYDTVIRLDYPDSGSVNRHRSPTCFARVPVEEGPVRRLVEVIRRERPQVLVTYDDDQQVYPHPDHWRAHERVASLEAWGATGCREAYLPQQAFTVAAAQKHTTRSVARAPAHYQRQVHCPRDGGAVHGCEREQAFKAAGSRTGTERSPRHHAP